MPDPSTPQRVLPTDLSHRDIRVIRYVARFRQLTSKQIRALAFDTNSNNTPSDRTLRRLTERQYLRRTERRLVGGSRGGSGQYVYELGRRGFYMFFEGRYNPTRSVNHHAIAIGDSYLAVLALERSGELRVAGVSTEPDCWQAVGGVELKPDMRVDVDLPSGTRALFWLEVDLATEAQKQIRGKLEAYWRAWNEADVSQMPVFPRVLWVAVDEERAIELRWIISQLPEQAQQLFSVTTLVTMPSAMC